MLIKICGMKFPENINSVLDLNPDFLGFIFHSSSPRFINDFQLIRNITEVKKVGVFVNSPVEEVLRIYEVTGLDRIQLHGNENPEYCRLLSGMGLKLIKAFSISRSFDFSLTSLYENYCDFFLFDAAGPHRGGNGVPFNWLQLKMYFGDTPFFLSGGIGPKDISAIVKLKEQYPAMVGVDLNSRFEISPGLKSTELLHPFVKSLKTNCHAY